MAKAEGLGALVPQTKKGRVRAGAAAAIVLGLLAVAVFVEPWSTTSYDIHDSGVWITNNETGATGRVNGQVRELDVVRKVEGDTKVRQDGQAVYLVTPGGLEVLDATDPTEGKPIELPDVQDAAVGGGVVAGISDIGTVSVVVVGGRPGGPGAVMKLGEDGKVAVGLDGTVAGFNPDKGLLWVLEPGGTEASSDELAKVGGEFEVSLVGGTPVVLDREEGRLLSSGRDPVAIEGGRPSLQHPGPASGAAVVAVDGKLLSIGLGGGTKVLTDEGAADPIRPVVDDRCTYAAWKGDGKGTAEIRCDDGRPSRVPIGAGQWLWRTGGPSVALNDVEGGSAYVARNDELVKVKPWPEDDQDQDVEEVVVREPQDPDGNTKPVAVADAGADAGVGARPDRVTYVNLLRNDYDADGDALFIAALDKAPKAVTVAQGGRALEVDLRTWKPGDETEFRFRYRISDGDSSENHLSDWADVRLTVVPGSENRPPERIENQALSLSAEAGKTVDYEVLTAFWDPDGDPIYLESVEDSSDQNRVSSTANGWVRFTAGDSPAESTLALVVRDSSYAEAKDGAVSVQVIPAGVQKAPELRPDFVRIRAGVTTTITPLANDYDPNRDTVRLTRAVPRRQDTAAIGTIETAGDTIEVNAAKPGDFVLIYDADDGPGGRKTQSTVAVRVYEGDDAEPPVALPDVVQVEVGRTATVDLLANDDDPNGALLAVSDLAMSAADAKQADEQVGGGVDSDYRTFRVDAGVSAVPTKASKKSITYNYTVSNGQTSASSTVTVVTVDAPGNRIPQRAAPEVISVRAGDAVRVPMSAIAFDLDNDPLSLTIPKQEGSSRAAPSGDGLRYFAPADAKAGEITLNVEVAEPQGNPIPVPVRIKITAGEENSAPKALDLEARVRSGQRVEIPIPLDGRDPDGDGVRLASSNGSDLHGELVEERGSQSFVFSATDLERTGPESFTYRLIDAREKVSEPATVRIVVLPVDKERPHPPVAVLDRVWAPVDGDAWVNPTLNDTDLDGDPLKVVPLDVLVGKSKVDEQYPIEGGCTSDAVDGGFQITTDDDTCSVPYAVVDYAEGDPKAEPKSLPVTGRIVVEVFEGFDGLSPIARDDHAVVGAGEDGVEVPILANDEDPDSAPGDLTVEVLTKGKGISFDGKERVLVAPVAEDATIIRYRVTDPDGHHADAAVRIPGAGENHPPVLVAEPKLITVKAGERETVSLKDYIVDPDKGDELSFQVAAPRLEVDPPATDDEVTISPINKIYAGETVLNVTATDDGDPKATASFPLKVNIEAADNRKPEWSSDPCVNLEAKQGWLPQEVSAKQYATDPDLQERPKLRFTRSGAGSSSGVKLDISAAGLIRVDPGTAKPGTVAEFTLVVTDPREGSAEQSCQIRVGRYPGPALAANPSKDTVKQGERKAVDVSKLVSHQKGELVVEDVDVVTGQGTATASGSGFTYTPPKTFSGEAAVRYTVSDEITGTNGAPRTAQAVVTFLVVGPPDPVTAVSAKMDGTDAILVSWNPGKNHGDPTKSPWFDVTAPGVTRKKCENPCRLTENNGLVWGNSYTFSVLASNEVGPARSAGVAGTSVEFIRPPAAPQGGTAEVTPGGATETSGAIRFGWEPGKQSGDKVKGYIVSSADDGGGTPVSGAEWSASSLPNGIEHCIYVRSVNTKDMISEGSLKICETPWGSPIISDLVINPDPSGGTGSVTWTSKANAAGGESWTLSVPGCQVTTTAGTGSGPHEVAVSDCPRDGTTETVATVKATNDPGLSSTVSSESVIFDDKPGLQDPPGVEATEDGVIFSGLPETAGGRDIVGWLYRVCSECEAVSFSGNGTVAFDAWEEVSVQVVACNSSLCGDEWSDWSESVTPWGTPPDLTSATPVWQDGVLKVKTVWSAPSIDGHVFEIEITDSSGTIVATGSPGSTLTISGADPLGGDLYYVIRDTYSDRETAEAYLPYGPSG